MSKTMRLDVLLLDRGLLPSRQAAQAAIMDGGIIVNGKKITKPGQAVPIDAVVEVVGQWKGSKYVSRGGLKLEQALDDFAIDVTGRTCLDLGASTGGFTDCLLQRGAQRVYAIDVGYGQLDWKLRQDERVVVKERVNARYLTPQELYESQSSRADLAVADLSFISLAKILPACKELLAEQADIVALLKPQFEAGKEAVGKGGVVREAAVHADVIRKVIAEANALQLQARALTFSPVKGPAGNIEFLIWLQKGAQEMADNIDIEATVAHAHGTLNS